MEVIMKKIVWGFLILMVLAAGTAVAEDMDKGKEDLRMAAHFNAFGILSGSYVANFEYLVLPWLGPMVEAGFYAKDGNTGFTGSFHARFHMGKGLNKVFIAPFIRYQNMGGAVTENSVNYDFRANVWTFGANVGKRWIIGPGFSIAVRAGWGPSIVSTSYDGAEPVNKELVDDLLGIFAGLDGELSIGWSF